MFWERKEQKYNNKITFWKKEIQQISPDSFRAQIFQNSIYQMLFCQ